MEIDSIIYRITLQLSNYKRDVLISHINKTPREFIKGNLRIALIYGLMISVLFFFVLDKAELPLLLLFPAYVVFFLGFFAFAFLRLRARIKSRADEIDREILFAGRYLLVKLYAGRPLLNALSDTAKSYGVSAKYIKEIVDDIDTGNPIEEALEKAITYAPSEKYRKILFQVNNALRLGIDVTKPLKSVINEITDEQEIEVKKYGKKLNSIVIFYMLLAIVIPSIGMTMFIAISSFINFQVDFWFFFAVIIVIIIIQLFFIFLFKAIRPQVNL